MTEDERVEVVEMFKTLILTYGPDVIESIAADLAAETPDELERALELLPEVQ